MAPTPLPIFGPDQRPDSLQRLSLIFRAGWSDETLPTHGTLDLLTMYAIAGDAPPSVTRTANVGPNLVSINFAAPPALLPDAVAAVCLRLAHPDVDMVIRMGALAADEPADPETALSDALINRFGARGPGLVGFGPDAMRRLTPDVVLGTAAQAFTTGNAAVATDSILPDGMAFPLCSGPYWQAMEPVASPVAFPAGYPHSRSGELIVTGLASAGDANSVACRILATRVANELRHGQGVVYSPQGFAMPLGAQDLLVTQTDLPPEAAQPAVKAIFDSMAFLADHGPTSEDLQREYQSTLRRLASDAARRMHGWTQARQFLRERRSQSFEEFRAALLGVTAPDVASAMRSMRDTVMLGVPGQTSASVADVHWESGAGDPRPHRAQVVRIKPGLVSSDSPQPDLRLSVGGLWRGTSDTPTGTAVRFADVACVYAWPDGARRLVRADAYSLTFEPALWLHGDQVLAAIDAAIDPAIVVPMPERDPDDLTVVPSLVERVLLNPRELFWSLCGVASAIWLLWLSFLELRSNQSPTRQLTAMAAIVLVVIGLGVAVTRLFLPRWRRWVGPTEHPDAARFERAPR